MDIHGEFDEKFKSIVDSYENQFELNLDIGSSLAITYHGEVVVEEATKADATRDPVRDHRPQR